MEFEKWWAKQTKNFDPEEIGLMQLAMVTWNAAQDIEREACAKIADARAMGCEQLVAMAADSDEATELRSMAWQFSVLAAEMRKRSNAKLQPRTEAGESLPE